ncbi:helix-turn-helix domain-containing protein [Levilactobacillus bambusae]|nr:helix-turn-helix transcriptional regulator [Levilactobacillus bambusae]
MNAGEVLVKLRKERGLSQFQLSDLSGVPQTTISGIENDGKTPGLKNAAKLAKVFQIHAEDLLPQEVAK